jgi:hypothetical protein
MRRSQTLPLGNLLKDYVKDQQIEGKLKEIEIVQHCQEILGKAMGKYVRKISMRNGELVIEVSSSLVKSELIMLREELRQQLNEKAGQPFVSRIVLK